MPPGLGKPSTHSRNQRRRIKKHHDAHPPSQAPPGSSDANALPLGTGNLKPKRARVGPAGGVASALNNAFGGNAEAGELDPGTNMDVDADGDKNGDAEVAVVRGLETTNEGGGDIMMAGLRNKNKKKGFMQSMAASLPKKIVFETTGTEDGVVQDNGVATPANEENGADPQANGYVRLVPPSETQEMGALPPRMFVTSVDVEGGMWGAKEKKKKKKKKKVQEEEWYEAEEEEEVNYVEGVVLQDPPVVEERDSVDWGRVENEWDQFVPLMDPEQLSLGGLIGWKVHLLGYPTSIQLTAFLRLLVLIRRRSRPKFYYRLLA